MLSSTHGIRYEFCHHVSSLRPLFTPQGFRLSVHRWCRGRYFTRMNIGTFLGSPFTELLLTTRLKASIFAYSCHAVVRSPRQHRARRRTIHPPAHCFVPVSKLLSLVTAGAESVPGVQRLPYTRMAFCPNMGTRALSYTIVFLTFKTAAGGHARAFICNRNAGRCTSEG